MPNTPNVIPILADDGVTFIDSPISLLYGAETLSHLTFDDKWILKITDEEDFHGEISAAANGIGATIKQLNEDFATGMLAGSYVFSYSLSGDLAGIENCLILSNKTNGGIAVQNVLLPTTEGSHIVYFSVDDDSSVYDFIIEVLAACDSAGWQMYGFSLKKVEIDASGITFKNIHDPINNQDAVTKKYVADNTVNTTSDYYGSVIDIVAELPDENLTTGDRYITDGGNAIYTYNGATWDELIVTNGVVCVLSKIGSFFPFYIRPRFAGWSVALNFSYIPTTIYLMKAAFTAVICRVETTAVQVGLDIAAATSTADFTMMKDMVTGNVYWPAFQIDDIGTLVTGRQYLIQVDTDSVFWTTQNFFADNSQANPILGSVKLSSMANMATSSFIGRITANAGSPEVLSAANARTILNVADGANVGVVPNGAISGATKTKITYDAKGLVTVGADATAGDVGAEPALGNPGADGYVLSSTQAGARSWIAAGGGGGAVEDANNIIAVQVFS